MALPQAFLDELRDRVRLSELIGRSVQLIKRGREFEACCPFHQEKSPSFTVSDEKGFAHCFGCGWHGDAFRWLADQAGMAFLDAVHHVAGIAGMEVPATAPAEAERAARAGTLREALDMAQAIYARQLPETGAVMEYLAARGIGPDAIERFGLGYARGGSGSLKGVVGRRLGVDAGLLTERDDGTLREVAFDRITVPIHDARGNLAGFGARVWPGRSSDKPKFVNSPDSALFDKGRTLFNLHRASPAARPQAENRLLVVEGYFDAIALDQAGFRAVVAPMGTALTEAQLTRCWRLHTRPVMLFDGDGAGRKAAVRACLTALPLIGPGRSLVVALLPDGMDPDDCARAPGGVALIEAAIAEARGLSDVLFDAAAAEPDRSPESTAAIWAVLREQAARIADEDLRAEYLARWRARFDREVSAVPQVMAETALHTVRWTEDGEYAFPDGESDSAARLIALVRALLKRRAERRAIGDEIKDLMGMAKIAGFTGKAITQVVKMIEIDLDGGVGDREAFEMDLVLYRRVLGVRGPLNEAMLPQLVDARAERKPPAAIKRRAAAYALIDAGGMQV